MITQPHTNKSIGSEVSVSAVLRITILVVIYLELTFATETKPKRITK